MKYRVATETPVQHGAIVQDESGKEISQEQVYKQGEIIDFGDTKPSVDLISLGLLELVNETIALPKNEPAKEAKK